MYEVAYTPEVQTPRFCEQAAENDIETVGGLCKESEAASHAENRELDSCKLAEDVGKVTRFV